MQDLTFLSPGMMISHRNSIKNFQYDHVIDLSSEYFLNLYILRIFFVMLMISVWITFIYTPPLVLQNNSQRTGIRICQIKH